MGNRKPQNIQNVLCFFCSGNSEYDVNFPESLSSQLRLRLVIEKAHVSLTDSSSWGVGGEQERLTGRAARSGQSPQRRQPSRYSPQKAWVHRQ